MEFNLDMMRYRCLAPFEWFEGEGVLYRSDGGKGNERFIYRNRGNKVLAVAHLDTVQMYDHFHTFDLGDDTWILNAQVDDRLGAHVILDVLPSLGIDVDVLLTEGEESGNSTARLFHVRTDYNWIFSFDRSGDDVVGYDYETPQWKTLMKENGFTPGFGSFSDIAYLYHLGVLGFNFGTAYYHNHDKLACANLNELAQMIEKFAAFFFKYQHEHMPYNRATDAPVKTTYYGRGRHWTDGDYDWGGEGAGTHQQEVDWYQRQLNNQSGRFLDYRRNRPVDAENFDAYDDTYRDIWDVLDRDATAREAEREARTAAREAGCRPSFDDVECPQCGHETDADQFFYSIGLCLDCVDDMIASATAEDIKDLQALATDQPRQLQLPAPMTDLLNQGKEESNGEADTSA